MRFVWLWLGICIFWSFQCSWDWPSCLYCKAVVCKCIAWGKRRLTRMLRFRQDIMTVTSRSSSCPGLLGVWPPYKATSESKLTLALVSSQFDFDIITRSCNNLASLIFKISIFSVVLIDKNRLHVNFYEGCTANRSPLNTFRGQRVCQRGKTMYASRLSQYNKVEFETPMKIFWELQFEKKTEGNLH